MMTDVADDPGLRPEEKEVIIRWSRDEDRATIHAEQAVVIRWLLDHPNYRETSRRVTDGVQHATTGTLPVGALKLQGKPRKSDQTNAVLGSFPDQE